MPKSPTESLMSDSILADWVTRTNEIGTTQSREQWAIAYPMRSAI
ncbi:hypothetical protein [Scytonema sp. UIC 10036]|nr:hypothetical protein [Scytonema sp. UIC 10036]